MARPEKIAEVELITQRLQAAQSLVLADYSGLTVEKMTNFRQQCRENKVVPSGEEPLGQTRCR